MAREFDSYYTPSKIASQLVSYLSPEFSPGSVADFSGGNGDLLEAAFARFPGALYFYNDINKEAVDSVALRHPGWVFRNQDFLSESFFECIRPVPAIFDLIVLNPPFSFRSRRTVATEYKGARVSCSGALAFLVRSLNILSDEGVLLCVLPEGCFERKADSSAWSLISQFYKITSLSNLRSDAFPSARASTRFVRAVRRRKPLGRQVPRVSEMDHGGAVRGSFQMQKLPATKQRRGLPLVHTSDLQDGEVASLGPLVSWHRSVSGPALLLPRVGKVDQRKICVLGRGRSVVISDCVIAIPVSTLREAKNIRTEIIENWLRFSRLYSGTGAPYITMAKLGGFLKGLKSAAHD